MARTRTPGITIDRSGCRTLNKEHRASRIFIRLGAVNQEAAEARLRDEIQRVELEHEYRALARPLFADGATRYLFESRKKRSAADIAWHVRLLIPSLGEMQLQHVHDETLESFVKARLASGVAATTINRSLEIVRTILNRSSRVYRDKEGRPWLEAPVPLITMQPESRRQPYPITWEEQDRLFPLLNTMNNTAWQTARRTVGLRSARIHDLRHTFACRLRAAGVSDEDRAALLGHSGSAMPQHYASPDVGRLIHLANRVLQRTFRHDRTHLPRGLRGTTTGHAREQGAA